MLVRGLGLQCDTRRPLRYTSSPRSVAVLDLTQAMVKFGYFSDAVPVPDLETMIDLCTFRAHRAAHATPNLVTGGSGAAVNGATLHASDLYTRVVGVLQTSTEAPIHASGPHGSVLSVARGTAPRSIVHSLL